MLINILQCLLIVAFIASSIYVLVQDRKNKYGLTVSSGRTKIADGSQGIETSIGRLKENDVVSASPSVSRQQMNFTFDGENAVPDEYFKSKCKSGYDYKISGMSYDFSKADKLYKVSFRFVPMIIAVLFTAVRYLSIVQDYKSPLLIIPFIILIVYQVASMFLVVNTAPIVECSISMLLTYYVYAMLYELNPTNFNKGVTKCCLGVFVYVFTALVIKLALMYIPLSKGTSAKAPKGKLFNNELITIHDALRFIGCIGIILLIGLNLLLAKSHKGAYNWVEIGPINFQPSELVKILLLFVVSLPNNKKVTDASSAVYLIGIPAICFLYCLIIKDIGALIEMGAVWALAVVLQSANILTSGLIISGIAFAVKLILRISSTAARRFNGWSVEDSIWKSLTSKGAFKNRYSSGFQSVNAITAAINNGGLFGMKYNDFDIMKSIDAADSDLVMSIIAQRYGLFLMFLLLLIFTLIFISSALTLRRQTKVQQKMTVLSLLLILTALILNVGGSFAVFPLTGVVLPFMSSGVSSAISYGIVAGIITSFSNNMFSIVVNNDIVSSPRKPNDTKKLLSKVKKIYKEVIHHD